MKAMKDQKQSEEGAALMEEAAKTGDAHALYSYGIILFHGIGVAEDKAKPCQWWQKAKAQGHKEAAREYNRYCAKYY